MLGASVSSENPRKNGTISVRFGLNKYRNRLLSPYRMQGDSVFLEKLWRNGAIGDSPAVPRIIQLNTGGAPAKPAGQGRVGRGKNLFAQGQGGL